jgi:hypothetical protein
MRRLTPLLLVVLSACTTGADSSTTAATTVTSVATTTTVAETTTTTRLEECAAPPYRVDVLPAKVGTTVVDPDDLGRDDHLEVAGTSSLIWLDGDGALAVALIRGTLPLEEWPGDRGEVSIDGARAVAGPFDDGSWVIGWFEQPGNRCDRFTMVFYPPIDPAEVRATLESMDRTAG